MAERAHFENSTLREHIVEEAYPVVPGSARFGAANRA